MSQSLKNSISELLNESSQFNTNDVLVNAIAENKRLLFSENQSRFPLAEFPKAILKEAVKTQRESGVNSLCRATGIVQLSINGKEVNTPIILAPLEFSIDKIKEEIQLIDDVDNIFLNPFLLSELRNKDVLTDLSNSSEDGDGILQQVIDHLNMVGLNTIKSDIHIIGNFHHHRYQVIKELEELLELNELSPNLSSLFGFNSEHKSIPLELSPDNLFPADTDHSKVFSELEKDNLVVQGPPGTGKSQVLTNIVGKLLTGNKTSIVVSEKRVALEVIQKKLSTFGLDQLCFIATSDHLSHSFLQELKSTWKYFESYEIRPANNLRLSEQYTSNLQMTLDLLAQKELIGGVSFHDFQTLTKDIDLASFSYSSQVASLSDFDKIKPLIEKVYSNDLHTGIGYLKKRKLLDDGFMRIDEKFSDWSRKIQALSQVFSFETWGDLNQVMKDAAYCQVYENDLYKKYAEIFRSGSRSNKRFLNLRKKFLQAKLEIEQLNANHSHWKISPSLTETTALLKSLEKRGFFALRKIKKRWAEISTIPYSEAENALKKHLEELAIIDNYSQIIIKFCELGIENPEIEVSLIHQTLGTFGEDQWEALEKLPADLRLKMTEHHAAINDLHHSLNSHFNLAAQTSLGTLFSIFKKQLGGIVSMREELLLLDENALLAFSRNNTFDSYKGELFASHWVQFKERFPAFSNFNMDVIQDKINSIQVAQNEESNLSAIAIENAVSNTFNEYHEILSTPARKLSDKQKELKARLRKGKSILVKEFSKSRSHPSLRELYNSEAREWIQLLKPVWLSNPTQLAKCFPMEQSLFDVAIFDEASQIPLQNALGTLQRAERIVVAGDEHQMGPSAYFKAGASEEIDLLHQANYHWNKVHLQHHYRSVHPDLIAFSNKHFYNGELKAYPSYSSMTPLHHHYVEEGKFIDRQNEIEAKTLATAIETALTSNGSVGIVAFSEEQLNCIWHSMSEKSQQILSEKIDNNQGFFKALENVQGDECDHLFISFGYGKNADNEFHMRFGPMATSNGRKRLNVLLTRAIRSIDIFCSVRSTDFKLSDNESINLLRQWMAYSENYQPAQLLSFPFELNPDIDDNQLTFHRIQEKLPLSQEIVTLHNVLENRGWAISYN